MNKSIALLCYLLEKAPDILVRHSFISVIFCVIAYCIILQIAKSYSTVFHQHARYCQILPMIGWQNHRMKHVFLDIEVDVRHFKNITSNSVRYG